MKDITNRIENHAHKLWGIVYFIRRDHVPNVQLSNAIWTWVVGIHTFSTPSPMDGKMQVTDIISAV